MINKPQKLIAGERPDDLVTFMRRGRVAAERYAADLVVAGTTTTWHDRLQQAAPRVADEVAEAIRGY